MLPSRLQALPLGLALLLRGVLLRSSNEQLKGRSSSLRDEVGANAKKLHASQQSLSVDILRLSRCQTCLSSSTLSLDIRSPTSVFQVWASTGHVLWTRTVTNEKGQMLPPTDLH